MKGEIFGQPFYTKRAAFHRKKPGYILSANGMPKGFPTRTDGQLTDMGARRLAFAQVANSLYGTFGTGRYKGAKMPMIAIKLAQSAGAHQTFNGKQHKAEMREAAHAATSQELATMSGRFPPSMPSGGSSYYPSYYP